METPGQRIHDDDMSNVRGRGNGHRELQHMSYGIEMRMLDLVLFLVSWPVMLPSILTTSW